MSASFGKWRHHDELAASAGSTKALEPELLDPWPDEFVVLGIEPQHGHLNPGCDRREQLGETVRRAGFASPLVRVASSARSERENRGQPRGLLRGGVDRGESAGALTDQQPALRIQVALRLRPFDRGEEIEGRALARAAKVGALAAAVRVTQVLSAVVARAVTAPHRDEHRVPSIDPLTHRAQGAVAADRAVGLQSGGGAMAQDDPGKRTVAARPKAGHHDGRAGGGHGHPVDRFAQRRVERLGMGSGPGTQQQEAEHRACRERSHASPRPIIGRCFRWTVCHGATADEVHAPLTVM